MADRFHGAMQSLREFLAEQSFLAPEDFGDSLYAYHEEAAVAHLFRVASGVDSAVLGEGEILGQVGRAAETARGEGTCGPILSTLFRRAVEVGKRARPRRASPVVSPPSRKPPSRSPPSTWAASPAGRR